MPNIIYVIKLKTFGQGAKLAEEINYTFKIGNHLIIKIKDIFISSSISAKSKIKPVKIGALVAKSSSLYIRFNPSITAEVTSYRLNLYVGENRTASQKVELPASKSTIQYSFDGPFVMGQIYYCDVVAVTADGESDAKRFSDSISK